MSVAKQLKSGLRRYFSIPGAFISLLNCDKFIVPNESRIKWLFGDEQCRNILLSHASSGGERSMKEDRKDGHIFDLFRKIQMSYLCHQLCRRINAIFNVSPFGKIGQVAGSELRSSSRMRQLLLLLSNVRDKVTGLKDGNIIASHCHISLYKKLNECIILVGKFAVGEEEESNTFIARALVENIMSWTSEQFPMKVILEDDPPVQPRRDVAKTLLLPALNALAHCSLTHASRIAFQVFQSRVLTLADWHEKYFDIVADHQDDGQNGSSEAAFFFAVYELVHCGFVKKLPTGRRREEAYEKVTMVWSSGR